MKLIVGLGNPGKQYEATRHNAGFWVVDALAARLGVTCGKSKWKALVEETRIGTERVILCKPQTYMNQSGESVREIAHYFSELAPERDLIVIYDDMDFPVGTLRLRLQGSAGGHNGMRSIIQHMGTQQFARVRLGIGRPADKSQVMQYVLSPFPASEREVVQSMVDKAADAVHFAVENSFSLAMNRFNT
ncbi:aminoacyl-tRNA hydrolase [Alicyclobacillus cycloheptanicus]|uniref:Peptidyl-tRNA hydrolase n=1 Tax=Alicyclobacillus cycloheptanicus TaxID=1457 RepID=A0ABT9XJD9_9BACL|nr:aminoacyl-tRNA hydrolase [Alicyclobacillus cycloheptanicus]MDQ0190159.1 PTH1 family peptidyl-tRNA hydrolase [Alicyclobacillus cycloheptanicus]WDM02586.1 aminoacyl-tRNA hydrolase [Alicyclobacillus cycloheptanicus]